MNGQAVALDIGTSGIRGQLLDLGSEHVVRTCVTSRNPIPGSNVMDHLSFAMTRGEDVAHGILLSAVHEVVDRLRPERLDRLSVCGNPIQLSLLEGIEIRDLAYAGENKLRSENVGAVDRSGHVSDGSALGFDGTEVVVPPAVRHEIGADALAMMLKSGFLDDDMCMVTDYGTNAEMALKVGDRIFTGSAAAGPALEGQQVTCGMLAGPGAVCDLVRRPDGWTAMVLDESLTPVEGPLVNLRSDIIRQSGRIPDGITGTGVVALVHAGMADDRILDSSIRNDPIRITRKVRFWDRDLKEAGKAMGAIRAGHMTLMASAGVSPEEVRTMYMAGATGTYVDPLKARDLGLVVPGCTRILQVGNTSLELAKDLALDPDKIGELNRLRSRLLTEHTMFASSDVFRDLYVMELGYWTGGMPLGRYRRLLESLGLGGYLDMRADASVEKTCQRDIRDIGESLDMIDTGVTLSGGWECSGCMRCVEGCPEGALSSSDGRFVVDTGRCLGTACLRCEENCPEKAFTYSCLGL